MTPLIFERTTSPLTSSDDGMLWVDQRFHPDETEDPARRRYYFAVIEADGGAEILATFERPIADAYIAGYDRGTR